MNTIKSDADLMTAENSHIISVYCYYEDRFGKKWKTVGFTKDTVLLRRFLFRYTIGSILDGGETVLIDNDRWCALLAIKTDVYKRVKY